MVDLIFDFETLTSAKYRDRSAVLSLAILVFDPSRFAGKPYTYEELLDMTEFFKFDVKDQVKNHGRKIEPSTVEWWSKQNKAAQDSIRPSSEDKPITDLHDWLVERIPTRLGNVWTRRNTFDPVILDYILDQFNQSRVYGWWLVKDTLSFIEGLSYGSGLKNNFIPNGLKEKFVHHDPRHDITMDVMRMQTIIQSLDIPF